MKQLLVIGIGAGDPDHVTAGAVAALNRVEVFFVLHKGAATDELMGLRREICQRFITGGTSYRVVEVEDPERDRSATDYGPAVQSWRERRIDLYERFILDELGDDGVGGLLVWGDPALYDGTILILDAVARRGRAAFTYEVVPGISSVSLLAARHRIPLNRVGEAIQITTGRRLAASGMPEGVDNVVVMLDAEQAFTRVGGHDLDIYWGAFLGTADEILVSGQLDEVAADIVRIRSEARARKGWMFDTYLLRTRRPAGPARR